MHTKTSNQIIMRYFYTVLLMIALFVTACNTDETLEIERTNTEFLDSIGGKISSLQWWHTSVTLKVNVTTEDSVKLMLLSSQGNKIVLYDYKEVAKSGVVTMTVPQGQGNTVYLRSTCNKKTRTQSIRLSGKPEETYDLNTTVSGTRLTRAEEKPASLCGKSINGNGRYITFNSQQLSSFLSLMITKIDGVNAKEINGQICHYH